MQDCTAESINAFELGHARNAADAHRHDDVAWPHRSGAPVRDGKPNGPSPLRPVIFASQKYGLGPDIKLHALRIELKPICELVFGNVHRPGVGKWHISKMIHADFVVEFQRAISPAPNVSDPLRLFDDQRADVKLAQPGRCHETGLASTDHDDIGIPVSEFACRLSSIEPIIQCAGSGTRILTRAVASDRLRKPLQLAHGGQYCKNW